ncbi:MAG: hypothetical protein ACLPXZ_03630 [Mycobacterium sp.]
MIEPVIDELIDRFIDRGTADLVAEFTHRYSLLIISRLLGIPADDVARIHPLRGPNALHVTFTPG